MGTYYGTEQQLIDKCDKDPQCSGYDYRGQHGYGRLCNQTAYPGSSRKCCGFKLCKKYNITDETCMLVNGTGVGDKDVHIGNQTGKACIAACLHSQINNGNVN